MFSGVNPFPKIPNSYKDCYQKSDQPLKTEGYVFRGQSDEIEKNEVKKAKLLMPPHSRGVRIWGGSHVKNM